MAGRLDGKVALITGAARGQGRSHAVRLAQDGADVIAVDICRQIDSVAYPLAAPADLARTVSEVQALGRRIVAAEADVRDAAALRAAVASGVAHLGAVDIVLANAGIGMMSEDASEEQAFRDQVEVNLFGVWNTVQAAAPVMIEQGRGGAIVLTGSTLGLVGRGGNGRGGSDGYCASKHAIVGLGRTWAHWLAPHNIRVNSVHPAGANTPMVINDAVAKLFAERSRLQRRRRGQPPGRPAHRSRRRQQRDRLASLRRGPLRHRRGAPGRRRVHRQVARTYPMPISGRHAIARSSA